VSNRIAFKSAQISRAREYLAKSVGVRLPPSPPPPLLHEVEIPFSDPSLPCLRIKESLGQGFETGLRVWPSSVLLCEYLLHRGAASIARPEGLRGARVLELGAGCGLTGCFAAAILGAHVLLTDRAAEDPESGRKSDVLSILEVNGGSNSAAAQAAAAKGGSLRIGALAWGPRDESRIHDPTAVPAEAGADFVCKHGPWDLVIAADTMYDADAVRRFLWTVAWLLRKNRGCDVPRGRCRCIAVRPLRSAVKASNTVAMRESCKRLGLKRRMVFSHRSTLIYEFFLD
jgi:predicted nicotinamide N-methyase